MTTEHLDPSLAALGLDDGPRLDPETGLWDESYFLPPRRAPFVKMEFPLEPDRAAAIDDRKGTIDPITLEVIEGGLEAAVTEGEAAVERTGRSTLTREQHDFRVAICTVDCQAVTHVSFAATPDPIREYFPLEEIHEGDVFLYNDVYASHGTITHLPDLCVVTPVFVDGRLIAFITLFGHTTDVGGREPGSLPITSTSIWEEGLQLPPVRYHSRGVVNQDIRNILRRNTRYPSEQLGDVDAFAGATRIIERRILALCERIGTETVEAGFYCLLDRCAETVRDVILPKIPDGVYVGEDVIDNDGLELDEPVKLVVVIYKDREKCILDWGLSDGERAGAVNWAVGGRFFSKWIGAFLKQFEPAAVMNEGVVQAFRCYVKEKTIFSPTYGLPVANRVAPKLRTVGAYTAAMANAFHGQVVADFHCVQVYGMSGLDQDGNRFLFREIFGAGSGGRPTADGTDAVDMVPHSKNLPNEFIEERYPVIVEQVALNPDSGGPGRYRGGLGYMKDVRCLFDGYFLTNVDRTAFGCFGVAGGLAGAPGGAVLNPGTAEEQGFRYSREQVPVKHGDVVRIMTPGGGGWGDPLERDLEAVKRDVLRELVSLESARSQYGVVAVEDRSGLNPSYQVDEDETAHLRETLRAERGPTPLLDRGPEVAALRAAGRLTIDEHLPTDWQDRV